MPLSLKVIRSVNETPKIRSFELADVESHALPEFTAGAHIDVAIKLPNAQKEWRPYSIASDPVERRHYLIAVLLEKESSGGSRYMHQNVAVGDILETSEPKSQFFLAGDASEHLFIAGGIGITPILSMTKVLAREEKQFSLHYFARTPQVMAFRKTIENMCAPYAHFYFDNGIPENGAKIQDIVNRWHRGKHVYACGPNGMIKDVRRICRAQGWPDHSIHYEIFTPPPPVIVGESIEVSLVRSGLTLIVPPTKSILSAVIEAGVPADFDCKRGECGVCTTRVLEGIPLHRDYYLNDDERRENKVMQICVSWAKTRQLVLDL